MSLDSRKRARSTTRWQSWFGPSALALFAYAGQIKGSPLLTWVEVDLTLLLGCLVALAFAIGLSRAGLPAPTVFVPLGLMAILLFGAFDLAPSGYPLSKVLTLYTFTLLSMTAPFVLLRTESQRKQFLVSLTALALVVTILTLVSPGTVSAYSTVVVLEGSNTIGTARMIATGVVIVLVTMVGARTSMSVRILMAAIATVMMLATVSSGSRGPFLALAIAFFGVLITAPEFRMFRRRAIVGAVVLSVVGVYALANAGGEGFARVFGFLAGERDESAEIRRFLWAQAIRAIEAFPLGLGWGSFIHVPGVTRFGIGDKLYPHNLILEVAVEVGILAAAAVVAYIVVCAFRARKAATRTVSTAIYGLLIFTSFNAMVSGDINDNRLMWMVLSCALILRAHADSSALDGESALVKT